MASNGCQGANLEGAVIVDAVATEADDTDSDSDGDAQATLGYKQ